MELKSIESRALAILREARGLRGKELALRLGLQASTYYEYERGDRKMSRRLLEQAAVALGLPPAHVDRTLAYLQQTDSTTASEDRKSCAS